MAPRILQATHEICGKISAQADRGSFSPAMRGQIPLFYGLVDRFQIIAI
jgi:hypothetical protein